MRYHSMVRQPSRLSRCPHSFAGNDHRQGDLCRKPEQKEFSFAKFPKPSSVEDPNKSLMDGDKRFLKTVKSGGWRSQKCGRRREWN